mmetsp:Transcript_37686/g.118950  ORF Transcript_37686/g.118950 Transcript_37686/m.118950 type:complete len:319 (-) Transcript_37686:1953-2909(-)
MVVGLVGATMEDLEGAAPAVGGIDGPIAVLGVGSAVDIEKAARTVGYPRSNGGRGGGLGGGLGGGRRRARNAALVRHLVGVGLGLEARAVTIALHTLPYVTFRVLLGVVGAENLRFAIHIEVTEALVVDGDHGVVPHVVLKSAVRVVLRALIMDYEALLPRVPVKGKLAVEADEGLLLGLRRRLEDDSNAVEGLDGVKVFVRAVEANLGDRRAHALVHNGVRAGSRPLKEAADLLALGELGVVAQVFRLAEVRFGLANFITLGEADGIQRELHAVVCVDDGNPEPNVLAVELADLGDLEIAGGLALSTEVNVDKIRAI